jgi:ATP-dependent RNA helicase DeaD
MNEETSVSTPSADVGAPLVADGAPVSGGAPAVGPAEPDGPTFAELGLHPDVLRAVEEMGFSKPMNVQAKTFPLIMAGRDLMVQSRTGSGKTAAFGIPFANGIVNPEEKFVQAIILLPTRELALQVAAELARICAYRDMTVVPVYGGAPMGKQVEQLRAGGQIVCGTPGRVLDHIRRGTLKLDRVRISVLDECDEMLSMGFQEDIEKILEETPATRQTLLFSATVPEGIQRISRRFLRNPEFLKLSGDYIGVHSIKHLYYSIPGIQREEELLRILTFEDPKSAIIFCNTREETGRVAAFLRKHGHDAEAISSDLAQNDRERVLARMRAGGIKFLVATDVAARGIDIEALSHVFNYTFPEAPEIYVHRTGRTGRAGKSGTAVSLIGPTEVGSFYYLKLLYKIKPEERALPSETEIRSRREGERVLVLRNALTADPGSEWRGLARRLTGAVDGERLVAALLAKSFADVENMPVVPVPKAPVVMTPSPAHGESRDERPRFDRDRERPRGDRERPRFDRDRPRGDAPRFDGPREGGGRPPREGGPRPPREGGERPAVVSGESTAVVGGESAPVDRSEIRRDWRERPAGAVGATAATPSAPVSTPAASAPSDSPSEGAAPAAPRSFGGPREDRPRERRPQRRGPAPLRNDTAPVEKEFWEVWSEERSKPEGAADAATPARAAGSPDDGGAGPVIAPPRVHRDEVEPGMARLYLNLGRKDGASERDVLDLLSANGGVSRPPELDIMNTHTYLNVPVEDATRVCEVLTGKELAGRALVCEPAKPRRR